MPGPYLPLRSSSLLCESCDPMELQRESSFFKQPVWPDEPLHYTNAQHHYYGGLQGPAHRDPSVHSIRVPTGAYQHEISNLALGSSSDAFQNSGMRGTWRYHQTLEAHQQNIKPTSQPSGARYLGHEPASDLIPGAFPESYQVADSSEGELYKEDINSCSTSPKADSPPHMDMWPLMLVEPIPDLHPEDILLARDSQEDEGERGEEATGDKPYARLIHEALMQAPGHRMMLREIYDWFVQNTNKPRESGTNGWQNSIRHNLSMNQAFENDRTDPANPTHQARKANSVWILTDDAIRHGVQSTTRYRKHGNNKKTSRSRVPAPLRQRSGAKGGRAARRAARLRREERMNRQDDVHVSPTPRVAATYGLYGADQASQEAEYFSVASPLTPEPEPGFDFSPEPDDGIYYYDLPDLYDLKSETLANQMEPAYEDLEPKADGCMKQMFAYPYTSPSQSKTMD